MIETYTNKLIQLVDDALQRSGALDGRLFHGRGRLYEGLEQVTVDVIAKQLVVSLFKPEQQEQLSLLEEQFCEHYKQHWLAQYQLTALIFQFRYSGAPEMRVLDGHVEKDPVFVENGLRYQLQLGKNQNSGLFLDMQNGRQWVQNQARDAKVLNLFSYTCGFSVAAVEGGAAHVVNVDMAKSALSRGRDNHRLNQHDLSKVTFMGHDILKSWGKIKKSGPYDLVVIDPPSFQKGSFALTKDYQKILRRLPELTTDNALVLACVNSPAVSSDFLLDAMASCAAEFEFVERLDNPEVFADIDEQASLKSLVFQRKSAEV